AEAHTAFASAGSVQRDVSLDDASVGFLVGITMLRDFMGIINASFCLVSVAQMIAFG
ncbi:MAG: hypothetical protein H6823_27335, partial [Planctomycetaceae bacterium]|nr:hypothetical protein [Planctomycetaceae bacterium]